MSKPLTIKQLYEECKKEIAKGNADKVIMISSDDEGNSYHYLLYSFTSMEKMEEPFEYNGKTIDMTFEYADERVAPKENTIILG